LGVKLKWKPNAAFANADASTPASAATNALSQSTCSVTISDPYLTGLAWPALFDAAQLYTQANIAAANNILLPPCGEGQDPYIDKCVKYADIDSQNDSSIDTNYAFLLISLWYEVKGTSFGTDFYFRVSGFSVSHGTKYPSVTIRGVEARSVVFNQSLVNVTLEEGLSIEQTLKQLAEKQGFSTSFCANTNANPDRSRVFPRTVRYKGVTLDEVIKKVLDSVNGQSLSLPTREYANKISMCTRGEVEQGCSVFYLGRGLYEGYEISGQPELTLLALNAEQASNFNNADPYVSDAFKSNTYFVEDVVPNKRKKAMEKVKKITFPSLFEKVPKNIKNASVVTGYVWRDSTPVSGRAKGIQVINEEATKINKDGLSLFGIAPNGTLAISYLEGDVQEADEGNGRVLIKTKYALQICEKEGSQKCFFRPILQESTGLSSVKVKVKDKVKISQEIGTSTPEKPEFVRFFITGHNNQHTTLNPKIVWDWAFPETDIPKSQTPAIVGAGNNVVSPAPKQALKDWRASTSAKPSKILMMAGHADFTSSGAPNEPQLNIELVKWAQRNAAAYGVSDFIEFYLPPSGNIPEADPRSQYSKTIAAIAAGKQVIEIHNDQTNGHSGVIPPTAGRAIWPLDDVLASQYGAFNKNWRDGLAIPRRGGTILEVGRMDGATTNIFISGTPAQKEALYRQLMEPTMKAIAAEKARTGATAAPITSASTSASDNQPLIIGRVGSTGSSSGPHLHVQWSDGRSITFAQVREFIGVSGIVTSPYGDPSRSRHLGIDIGGNDRAPISIFNGASVATINETKCTVESVRNNRCGDGFGNNITINTPKGQMILAHLAPQSIPSNIAGLKTSSGGGKTNPTVQGSPTTSGLMIETSFKGVPRALRIIPGRTILSFITNYDEWVEQGRPATIDPGVWIPNRFKNWFASECEYKWREGDLRVQLEAVSAWGTSAIKVPTFQRYLESMRATGDVKISSNYYDYIRSLGGLNWKTENGKDSTEEYCREAQELSTFLSQGGDTTSPSPTGSESSFPTANCEYSGSKYPADRVNKIIRAAYSGGINTKAGLAGVVGNALHESRQGEFLNPAALNPDSKAFGIFQWLGVRKSELQSFAKGLGKSASDFDAQMQWFVAELKGRDFRGPETVSVLNRQSDPATAAFQFNAIFERAPGQGEAERKGYAQDIFSELKCVKPS
jgi:hypothetical protein